MEDKDTLKKEEIEQLEKRIEELEKRPQYIPYTPPIQVFPQPWLPPNPNLHYHGQMPCYNNPCYNNPWY